MCETYRRAAEAHIRGEHVISTDEKTGIQALERIAPTKPPRPGLIERIEGEYVRHGTLCLTANFEVATGEIASYTIAPTRNELDFANHIERTISNDPTAPWTFVADNLNTHLSATLVERIGTKGKSGVLETPKHCSWLNQVEMWFSVLVRRLLKRSSFESLTDLRVRIEKFIAYFNTVLARPYRWTFTGRALAA